MSVNRFITHLNRPNPLPCTKQWPPKLWPPVFQ